MRLAYFDCFSGISGDMTLGALVDAGVDRASIVQAVGGLGLECELTFETVKRAGFRATHARVSAPPQHHHRHLHHIEAIIEGAALTDRQRDLAKRIFRKLGEAEAHVHGTDLRKVHFHEVGAVDSIVDIVGSAVGLDLLGVERVESSPVPTGRGQVQTEHGLLSVPAPATAELLKGTPLAEATAEFEQTTPTGAAIITTVAASFGPLPAMTIEAIGIGAGTKDPKGLANVLRLMVGRTTESEAAADRVWVCQTNLDDVPGEVIGHTTTRLLKAGALDAYVTPVIMKKNRPAAVLTFLCDESKVDELESIVFAETATLGIRRYSVLRHKRERQGLTVETPLGPVLGKLAWLDGRGPTFSPEYDDCVRIANERGVPLREVYLAAHQAHREGRTSAGGP